MVCVWFPAWRLSRFWSTQPPPVDGKRPGGPADAATFRLVMPTGGQQPADRRQRADMAKAGAARFSRRTPPGPWGGNQPSRHAPEADIRLPMRPAWANVPRHPGAAPLRPVTRSTGALIAVNTSLRGPRFAAAPAGARRRRLRSAVQAYSTRLMVRTSILRPALRCRGRRTLHDLDLPRAWHPPE